jgi:hypothetical protein
VRTPANLVGQVDPRYQEGASQRQHDHHHQQDAAVKFGTQIREGLPERGREGFTTLLRAA